MTLSKRGAWTFTAIIAVISTLIITLSGAVREGLFAGAVILIFGGFAVQHFWAGDEDEER